VIREPRLVNAAVWPLSVLAVLKHESGKLTGHRRASELTGAFKGCFLDIGNQELNVI
jgi:hypothetical protein